MIKVNITKKYIIDVLFGILISSIILYVCYLFPNKTPQFFPWIFGSLFMFCILRLVYLIFTPKSYITFNTEQKNIIIQNYDIHLGTRIQRCENEIINFDSIKQVKRIFSKRKGPNLMLVFKNNSVLTFYTNKKTIKKLKTIFEINDADFSSITDLMSTFTNK